MSAYDTAKVESIDEQTDLDDRDVRALTEFMTVLGDVGRARGAPDLYTVVSQSGREYLVDGRDGVCECPDASYSDSGFKCKHIRRVAFATGDRPIPGWVDADAVDPDLGRHVDGPQVAVADGGQLLEDDDQDAARPDDCSCLASFTELSCWPCYREGHTTPNPDAEDDDE